MAPGTPGGDERTPGRLETSPHRDADEGCGNRHPYELEFARTCGYTAGGPQEGKQQDRQDHHTIQGRSAIARMVHCAAREHGHTGGGRG